MKTLCLLFFALLKVANSELYCVDIRGQLKCNSDSLKHKNVKIEIIDRDYSDSESILLRVIDPDDLMGMTYTHEDGSFSLYCCGHDFDFFWKNPPEPYFHVTHSCNTILEHSYSFDFSFVFAPQTLDIGVLFILDDGKPYAEESDSMQESHDVIDEISWNFENLDLVASGYGRTKSFEYIANQTSSIAALMCGVQKYCCAEFTEYKSSSLYNHWVGYDENGIMIYMKAEIRYQSLDKGAQLTEESMAGAKYFAMTYDVTHQYIDKKLGGIDCGINAFPLSPNADINPWQTAITTVYDHIKQGEENKAHIMYVMDYAYEPGRERPSNIYYRFKLYSNGELVGEPFVGKIQNPIPTFKRE